MPSALRSMYSYELVKKYIKIETYDRDGGHRHPRYRIEFRKMPIAVALVAVQLWNPCVACDRLIHPIRARKTRSKDPRQMKTRHLYYAAACPLSINMGCSRGTKAEAEYKLVVAEHLR